MRKALVFFDIDRTIWDEKQNIPDSTIRALKQLRKNGHKVFLNSGRTRAFIRNEDVMELSLDGVVAGCGTYVESDHEVLLNHTIERNLLVRTIDIFKTHHMPLVLEGCDYLFADAEDFPDDPFFEILKHVMGDYLIPIEGAGCDIRINKYSVNLADNNLSEMLGDLSINYNIIMHGEDFMEVVPKGFSKASGMKLLSEHFGIPMEDTFAFGDSSNDIDMLKAAGKGIVMGNGTDDAKSVGDYITKDLEDDGVEHALNMFGLI